MFDSESISTDSIAPLQSHQITSLFTLPFKIDKIACVSAYKDKIKYSHPIKDSKLNIGFGGLSGKPVYEHTLKMVSKIRKIVDNNFTIIGSGGVSTTSDVWKLIASGANAVQIYSGVVYEGPFIAYKINKELKNIFLSNKISSVKELFCSESPFPSKY